MATQCKKPFNKQMHFLIKTVEEIQPFFIDTNNTLSRNPLNSRISGAGHLHKPDNLYIFTHYLVVFSPNLSHYPLKIPRFNEHIAVRVPTF